MREVVKPGICGYLLLATVVCMAGCVMPSRESLKEPGWNPNTSTSNARDEVPGRTALIKPFIPPDKPVSSAEDRVPVASGLNTDPAATAAQPTAPQDVPVVEAPLSVPLQPAPQPVKWQEPSEHQTGFQQPSAAPETSQFARVPDQSVPDVATRTEAPDNSLATVEPPRPTPLSPQPAVPAQPAPPSLSHPSMEHTIEPAPPVTPAPQAQIPRQSAQVRVAGEAKSGSREWEDQRVKEAAFKLAKKFPGVKKGKICYSVKTDDWWIVLYEDEGTVYDVKQYTWNRDQEKLDQFLVLKRIGKNRLEEDISVREADKACEPLDFPQAAQ